MNLLIPLIIFFLCGSAASQEPVRSSSSAVVPLQILEYREVFKLAASLEDHVWAAHVPYADIPVLAYDVGKQEEFLINHPNPDPAQYEITDFSVNGKKVWRKRGELTIKFPGGQCCREIRGRLTITMGYGDSNPLEETVRTFLHEGFHYYQFAPLFEAGVYEESQDIGRAGWKESPRTAEYDRDLVVEGRLLHELSRDTAPASGLAQFKQLAAVDAFRRTRLSTSSAFLEDSEFLVEGLAVYAEMKGLSTLAAAGSRDSEIPQGTLPDYSYFTGARGAEYVGRYLLHYGPAVLANMVNLPSTALGEPQYRYARALTLILDKLTAVTGKEWKTGLFPFPVSGLAGARALAAYADHVRKNSLSQRLSAMAPLSDEEARGLNAQAAAALLSPSDKEQIAEKIRIENDLDHYPAGDGWTYRVEAGGFLQTYFDHSTGTMYCGRSLVNCAYLKGLFKLVSPDGRLTIEKVTIPVVSNMFKGDVHFKDLGRAWQEANLACEGEKDGACAALILKIPGLELTAKNASFTHDEPNKETLIRLVRPQPR